ncbi:MAG: orotidine-5'-phosphate decarboxylase [Alphaproteobacteria bacterium]
MARPDLTPRERLILALDLPTVGAAEAMIASLGERVGVYKIGLQLLFAGGVDLAARLADEGHDVFVDAKLLDIDNTVAAAVASIERLGARFLTVHAYPHAMRAAVGALRGTTLDLLGVSVLTSMDDTDLAAAGYEGSVRERVMARAADARVAGMAGVVASPAETEELRKMVGEDLILVIPGIRPKGTELKDQKRAATPAEAIRAGADYLVVGRPILDAADPSRAADAIVDEIAAATG